MLALTYMHKHKGKNIALDVWIPEFVSDINLQSPHDIATA